MSKKCKKFAYFEKKVLIIPMNVFIICLYEFT